MKKGRHVISGLILIASVLFSSLAQADFELKDSTLPVQSLEIESNGVYNNGSFGGVASVFKEQSTGEYYFGASLGLLEYGRPDTASSTVWKAVPDRECIALKSYPLKDFRMLKTEVIGKPETDPFPLSGCFGFESKCTTRDGKLHFSTVFEGVTKTKKRRGGWTGSEGWMDVAFYTGQRIFTVTYVPTGQKVIFIEKLNDSAGYSTMQYATEYLNDIGVLMFFDIKDRDGKYGSYCIKIPK